MDYQEFPVPRELQRHVQCVWRLRDPAPAATAQTIYPDGRCELIVHLATAPRCWDSIDGWHDQSRHLFAAQRVTAVRLESRGPLDCVGVRLAPAASALVAARSLPQLRDRIVNLTSVARGLSSALGRAAAAFVAGDATMLWRLLARRCAKFSIDARMESAATRIERSAGQLRIEAVARAAGMSARGFQTRFRASVGLTPKEFARLARLQATLRALDQRDVNLSSLAADAGFADQAHATRELKRITGLAPAKLRAELRRDRAGDAAVRLAAAFVRGYAV